MTRKRFIKLIMARGKSINQARAIAFLYNHANVTYSKAYIDFCIKDNFRKIGVALKKKVGDSISVSINSFKKLAEALAERSDK